MQGPLTKREVRESHRKNTAHIIASGLLLGAFLGLAMKAQAATALTYPIVHSGVVKFYDASGETSAIKSGEAFYGQDANYLHHPAQYQKNNDGTVSDLVTGLMWEVDMGQKMTLEEAQKKATASRLGGHADWRVPTLKELYSLANFSGRVMGERAITPFIDTNYFNQPIGDTTQGERQIDAQTWSSTVYIGKTMRNEKSIFGMNFVDGRIKSYPITAPRTQTANKMYFRMVRGNPKYGLNQYVDNKDGTISDLATGLMWQKEDSKQGLDWQAALQYAENLTLAGHSDWRMPSVKELQSIVDYSRAPTVTNSAAIDPIFSISMIDGPNGQKSYPFYWSGTTLLDGPRPGDQAAYIVFGEAWGQMRDELMDLHGAGSQRSDPKSGDASKLPQYFGPQGDIRYVFNYVRSVRIIK